MSQSMTRPMSRTMPPHEQVVAERLLMEIQRHYQPDDILFGLPHAEGQRIEWRSASVSGLSSSSGMQNGCHLWLHHLQQSGTQAWARLNSSPLARIQQHGSALSPTIADGGVLLCALGNSSHCWGLLALFGTAARIRDWQQDASLQQRLHLSQQHYQQGMTAAASPTAAIDSEGHLPPLCTSEMKPSLARSPGVKAQEVKNQGEHSPSTSLLEQRLLGQSRHTHLLRQQVQQASQHALSVLLLGETGTGKEVVARLLHDLSPRKHAPFIAINCAAIPENLIESELFGFQKGAFSGASAPQAGLLAQAHGGTLFLDEIGDMPLTMQAKLLRVLESRRYRPLGCSQEQPSEFRLIAATHQPLDQQITERRFRVDLYHRLCQCQIQLTPLRERPDDLPPLSLHFIRQFSQQHHRLLPGLAPDLLSRLSGYGFPGNVRELKNLLEVTCAHTEDGAIVQWHNLPPSWQQRLQTIQEHGDNYQHIRDLRLALRRFEAEVIRARLDFYQGNRGLAAASLGLPKRTLDHKCQKLELR